MIRVNTWHATIGPAGSPVLALVGVKALLDIQRIDFPPTRLKHDVEVHVSHDFSHN